MKLKELDAMWEELIAEGRQFYRCGASLFEQAMRKAIAAERARYDKLHELVEEFGPAGLNASVIAHWEKAKREREARVLRFVATSWRHEFPLNDHDRGASSQMIYVFLITFAADILARLYFAREYKLWRAGLDQLKAQNTEAELKNARLNAQLDESERELAELLTLALEQREPKDLVH